MSARSAAARRTWSKQGLIPSARRAARAVGARPVGAGGARRELRGELLDQQLLEPERGLIGALGGRVAVADARGQLRLVGRSHAAGGRRIDRWKPGRRNEAHFFT